MKDTETVPIDLDWVKVRLGSMIDSAFGSLRTAVEADVKSFNDGQQLAPSHQVRISSEISPIFLVIRRTAADNASVVFHLRGNSVEIRQGAQVPLVVTPIFSDLGRCRWKLNDEEFEQWQVRKMALEGLLFPLEFRF